MKTVVSIFIFMSCVFIGYAQTGAGSVAPSSAPLSAFTGRVTDFGGPYFIEIKIMGKVKYAVLNNFVIGQSAFVKFSKNLDECEVIGHVIRPYDRRMTEASVNRLPDKSYMAILRTDNKDLNYVVSVSGKNGKNWSEAGYAPFIPTGSNSKPIFEKFGNIYYLGWQESTRIDNVSRTVFNIDVSRDCVNWERKYRFETTKSFQYPSIRLYNDKIYVCATQGNSHHSRKEFISFGLLENLHEGHIKGKGRILPDNRDTKSEGDKVLSRLKNIVADEVKGAHDADMFLHEGKAYIVYMANSEPDESPHMTQIYDALSIVDLATGNVEKVVRIAASEQQFENGKLPKGAVFVPRLIMKNKKEFRIYFTSEEPEKRQSQMWYTDFDFSTRTPSNMIYRMKLKTADGIFDLNAKNFFEAAVSAEAKMLSIPTKN